MKIIGNIIKSNIDMKNGDIVYCIDESAYSDHITKRNSYIIEDSKSDKIRIPNDRENLVWIPIHCFTSSKIPNIISINIDDEINDFHNECVEVTIKFSDGEKRWATFMTTNWLNGLFNIHRNHVTGNGLILLKELSKSKIKQIIVDLDKQNELIEITNKYNCQQRV